MGEAQAEWLESGRGASERRRCGVYTKDGEREILNEQLRVHI